jgi:hypothetical protein
MRTDYWCGRINNPEKRKLLVEPYLSASNRFATILQEQAARLTPESCPLSAVEGLDFEIPAHRVSRAATSDVVNPAETRDPHPA